MALNVERSMLFYGAYHHDPVNKAIHITCVPAILMTAICMGTYTPALHLPKELSFDNLPLNVGTAAGLLYAALYVIMEPIAGGLLAPLLVAGTALSNHLSSTYASPVYWWALGIHLMSWIAQFVGHGVFEGRAPALLDNLAQALFLALMFVWLEILFSLGYKPELRKRLDTSIEKEISKFKKGQQTKTNGRS